MLNEDRLDTLPLKERIKKAQYLSRELSEHLVQAYLPRLSELRTSTKEFNVDVVSDQQVLDRTTAVLQAEEFTQKLHEKLRRYLTSIQSEMEPMLFNDGTSDSSTRQRQPDFQVDELEEFD